MFVSLSSNQIRKVASRLDILPRKQQWMLWLFVRQTGLIYLASKIKDHSQGKLHWHCHSLALEVYVCVYIYLIFLIVSSLRSSFLPKRSLSLYLTLLTKCIRKHLLGTRSIYLSFMFCCRINNKSFIILEYSDKSPKLNSNPDNKFVDIIQLKVFMLLNIYLFNGYTFLDQ